MVKRLPALFLVLVVALLTACATGSSLPGLTASGNKASVTGGPAVSGPAYKGGTSSGPGLTTPNKGKGGRLPALTSPSTKARKGDPFNAGPRKVNAKKKKKEQGLFPKGMRK
ncbi:MAG: hypothetical protein M0D57_06035 [Sphingobacteriales bacterium JAD_PAG50586_3]|nr:MAG: hypothetical protein M0D57_06035 [Sphingobacteriales bacterium JAD_PAG50586_3]